MAPPVRSDLPRLTIALAQARPIPRRRPEIRLTLWRGHVDRCAGTLAARYSYLSHSPKKGPHMRLAAILLSFPALHAALMPLPVLVQPVPGAFPINANFIVDTVGPANARLAPAVKSFLARVTRQTGITYSPLSPAPG